MRADPDTFAPAITPATMSPPATPRTAGRRVARNLLALSCTIALAGLAAGCSGSSPSTAASGTTSAARPARGPAGDPDCPVGRWNVTAKQEFTQIGLGDMTDGGVQATDGTIRIVFGADHTYTFTYDRVVLSLGNGAGTAAVNGPVSGTWQLVGDTLRTTVGSSRLGVRVNVAGVTVRPSSSLNKALQNGLPGSARVNCSAGRLVTTITTGAAAGRQVTFTKG